MELQLAFEGMQVRSGPPMNVGSDLAEAFCVVTLPTIELEDQLSSQHPRFSSVIRPSSKCATPQPLDRQLCATSICVWREREPLLLFCGVGSQPNRGLKERSHAMMSSHAGSPGAAAEI